MIFQENGGVANPLKLGCQWVTCTETSSTAFQSSGTDVFVTYRLDRVKVCENMVDFLLLDSIFAQ